MDHLHRALLKWVVFGLSFIMLGGLVLSCTTQGPQPEVPEGISQAETEDMYVREFLNMAEVYRQIREGQAELLAKQIEAAMPAYLKRINTFERSTMKSAGFIVAGTLVKKYNIALGAELNSSIEEAEEVAGQVLSDDCYDLLDCRAPGCVPWPTSLRGANVNSPNIMGWHYVKDSYCGFSWPKFWKLECGQPIALVPCRKSE
jgi:hypothetical protein